MTSKWSNLSQYLVEETGVSPLNAIISSCNTVVPLEAVPVPHPNICTVLACPPAASVSFALVDLTANNTGVSTPSNILVAAAISVVENYGRILYVRMNILFAITVIRRMPWILLKIFA